MFGKRCGFIKKIAFSLAVAIICACLISTFQITIKIITNSIENMQTSCGNVVDQRVADGESQLDYDNFDRAIATSKDAISMNKNCGAAYALAASANQKKLLHLSRRQADYKVLEPIRADCIQYSINAIQLHAEIDRMVGLQKVCSPAFVIPADRWNDNVVDQDEMLWISGPGYKRRIGGAHSQGRKSSRHRSECLEPPVSGDMRLPILRLLFMAGPGKHPSRLAARVVSAREPIEWASARWQIQRALS